MKSLLFVLITSTLALSPEETAKLKDVSEKCLLIHAVAPKILEDLYLGVVHDDADLQDYLHCVFVVMQYADENGKILLSLEESRKLIADEVPNAKKDVIIRACNGLESSGVKRRIFLIYKCYVSHLAPRCNEEADVELDENSWAFVVAPNPED